MIDLQGYEGQLLVGTMMTIRVAVSAVVFGLLMGLVGAAAKLSASRVAHGAADAYTTVFRGEPPLLILLILYFGGTGVLSHLSESLGWGDRVDIDAFTAGVFGLGLIFGAYATEVFRGAFLAVPQGQIDAAKACGMSWWLVFRRIQFPQVLRFALPGLGNLWMVLLKDTALISVIQLDELMRKTYIAAQATKLPFTFYLAAAVIYLCLTTVSMVGQRNAERWASRGVRSA
ncbi:MAG: ABC transporter permease [Kiloniellales bacterium]